MLVVPTRRLAITSSLTVGKILKNRNDTDLQSRAATLPPPNEVEAGKETEQQLPLFSSESLRAVEAENERWHREMHDPLVAKRGPWKEDFTTVSDLEVNTLATPSDRATTYFVRHNAFPSRLHSTLGI